MEAVVPLPIFESTKKNRLEQIDHLEVSSKEEMPDLSSEDITTKSDDGLFEVPDEVLMERVGAGDESGLRGLIDRWQTPLLNFFFRSLNDYGQAEDLAQVVFIRLYRAAPRYQATAKFSTYLFHIARRLLINEFHKSSRRPFDATDPAELRAADPGNSERNLDELEEIFRRALERLPEKQRSAILLLKQQDLSYTEIASVMNATESAVKTWIFRARKTLKQELQAAV